MKEISSSGSVKEGAQDSVPWSKRVWEKNGSDFTEKTPQGERGKRGLQGTHFD